MVKGVTVDVPNLTGLDPTNAVAQLESLGLTARCRRSGSPSSAPEGTVAYTNPEAGASVSSGRTITIYISTGRSAAAQALKTPKPPPSPDPTTSPDPAHQPGPLTWTPERSQSGAELAPDLRGHPTAFRATGHLGLDELHDRPHGTGSLGST